MRTDVNLWMAYKCWCCFKNVDEDVYWHQHDQWPFMSYVGITRKQLESYRRTGKLKVRPSTHALLRSMAELPTDSPHFNTMYILMEIKHGKRSNI